MHRAYSSVKDLPDSSLAALLALRFPIQYLEVAESLVKYRHGRVSDVRSACGLPKAEDPDSPARIDGCQLIQSVSIAVDHCLPDTPPALQILAHFPLTAHGALGLLAMTSSTVGDALEAALKYHMLVMPLFEMRRQPPCPEGILIRVVPTVDLGPWRGLITEIVIGALRNLALYTNIKAPVMAVEFAHHSTWSIDAYTDYFGIAPTFSRPWNSFLVGSEFLSTPLITGSPTTHANTHHALMGELQRSKQSFPFSQEVRHRLLAGLRKGMIPNSDFVATDMAISTRTLSRRLADENQSFGRLAEQVRVEHAQQLLLTTQLSVMEIAHRVDFADASSFTRAFKRATQKTPAQFRNNKH